MKLSTLAAMGDFWRVVREFNPEGIEREAVAPLRLLIAGEPGAGKRSLVEGMAGSGGVHLPHDFLDILDVDYRQPYPSLPGNPDLIVLVVRLDLDLAEQSRQAADLFGRAPMPVLLIFSHADTTGRTREERNAAYRAFSYLSPLRMAFLDARDPEEVRTRMGPLLLDALSGARTALARRLPPLRSAVAEQIIAETCRVNAQFALAANLPANIPFFGGIAGDIADFFVLTKNQVMMVLRLGAIYGRDIAPTMQVVGELAPVVGGGILWRSAARMAAGMLPSLLAIAPKTTIAYVGTYVAGQAARYYFDEGRKPPKELLQQFGAEGARLCRSYFHRSGPRSVAD